MCTPLKTACFYFEEWIFHKKSLALKEASKFQNDSIFEMHAARFRKLEAAAEVLAEYQAEVIAECQAESVAMEEKIRAGQNTSPPEGGEQIPPWPPARA